MNRTIDGKALIYCDGAFNTPNGKTAHGLVRFTERYEVTGVIDRKYAGQDAGMVLDGKNYGIPVFKDLKTALDQAGLENRPGIMVVGLAPDGGRLPPEARAAVKMALDSGMDVDSGLHDFLYKDEELMAIAEKKSCRVRDIRRTPDRDQLHFFTGKIEEVDCLKIALLGTDSAIGKRTTAWIIVHAFRNAGLKAEMVGTGQTAWMQGAKYSMMMDSCINDFISGEIEHAVHEAWKNESPDLIVIEGQGSLMNPAYPGGYEILAAGRPDIVVLQHAPARKEYDGFPGYPIQPLSKQIGAIEYVSEKPVVAITINHEDLKADEIQPVCDSITKAHDRPAYDVLVNGAEGLAQTIIKYVKKISVGEK
jgi:uncharacterized NAD-dependent epimerase/dehydratase family protein